MHSHMRCHGNTEECTETACYVNKTAMSHMRTKSRWEHMEVMANTDSCMVALYTTCDLNITRLPTPHVN